MSDSKAAGVGEELLLISKDHGARLEADAQTVASADPGTPLKASQQAIFARAIYSKFLVALTDWTACGDYIQ
ncbi:uncharacterized protein TrAtP1_005045 [Trichoderma atroviride]|uniref:uncharacterized protein n=1 Tax=Hypocrea atroviridis TaxID=63577 RepID=UPI003333C421|nr:hypothetical protein TrAtP1_005045 [Trichoderma atroviride]